MTRKTTRNVQLGRSSGAFEINLCVDVGVQVLKTRYGEGLISLTERSGDQDKLIVESIEKLESKL